ncbi:MAG: hypothetical protein LH702_30215 [Phormidesmis sp. CAN_BIN44]|nr:hypothetical protein [Phormidesmis sp. CAN_BIN44]
MHKRQGAREFLSKEMSQEEWAKRLLVTLSMLEFYHPLSEYRAYLKNQLGFVAEGANL